MATVDRDPSIHSRKGHPQGGRVVPIPGSEAWDAQFGRGWKIYVIASLSVVGITFVCLITASTPLARVHALAVVIAAFAAAFFGALLYQYIRGIGIPMGFYRGERLIEQRVIAPSTHPLQFRLFIATFLSLCLAAIVAAVWMYAHADLVARYSLDHADRESQREVRPH